MSCLRVLLLCLVMPASALGATRTALVIGNAKYEPAVGALKNTANDARTVGRALRELGFAVIEKTNVTRDDLLKAVADFRKTLPNAEVALFYFAGHGISVNGANYLLPVKSGYHPEGQDDVALRLLAETRLFNVEQAVADMKSGGAACNLIILDACRNTPVARTKLTRAAGPSGGLTEMNPPAGSLIAFATDAGQVASDGGGVNGVYTEELLKHLRTPGLTIEQVFKRTRAGVLERSGGSQIPAEYSRLIGEDICLAGPAPRPESPSAPESPNDPLAAALSRAVKADPVPVPGVREINRMAADGRALQCLTAIRDRAEVEGAGEFAAVPLSLLLEQVKEDLKDLTAPGAKTADDEAICAGVLEVLPRALPETHSLYKSIAAKAHNRRGDSYLLLGLAERALAEYEAALPLAPDDAYILYNRGRAKLALGQRDAAKADLIEAAAERFNQPKARKLAQEALEALN